MPTAAAHSIEDRSDDLTTLAVEQTAAAGGTGERDLLFVEAEQVQQRGVVVVVGDDVLDGLVAEFVGGAVTCSRP